MHQPLGGIEVTMEIPKGWTDDMNVEIGNGRSVGELAESIMKALLDRTSPVEILGRIRRDFALSEDDAELAFDRAQGGIVRAVTGNAVNRPSRTKDPIAYHTFEAVWKDFPKVSRFGKKRDPSGVWVEWLNEQRR